MQGKGSFYDPKLTSDLWNLQLYETFNKKKNQFVLNTFETIPRIKFFCVPTGSPDEWLAENIAHLLILCGDVITSKMLISKAINGRMIELSSVTTSFCVVISYYDRQSLFLLFMHC